MNKLDECDWADTASSSQTAKPIASAAPAKPVVTTRSTRICYAWNHSPDTVCLFPDCAYEHICLYCAKDNQAIHKDHKEIFCKRQRSTPAQIPRDSDPTREAPTVTSSTEGTH